MRRLLLPLVALACLVGLTLACYGRALVLGEQFGYRDAAHYYYPLYERVQREWNAGRWPLWEPEENAGMPLMGNPTAAVLYPGKLIFALASYPWGMRLYVVGHGLLACAAVVALLRHWNVSLTGSVIAGLAYAFSGPILFQHCNIIYLVGAAWAPLGLRAVDRWLRLGNRWGLIELALVLALETLGGDPEVAYLTGVAAGGYALGLARMRSRQASGTDTTTRSVRWVRVGAGLFLIVGWIGITLLMERVAAATRTHTVPPSPLIWMRWVPPLVVATWVVAGATVVVLWLRRRGGMNAWLVPMLAGLAFSAGLAGVLMAAQLFPIAEFAGLSARASVEGPHDIFPFSLHPLRVVEFIWPNVFGTPFHGNRSWMTSLPPISKAIKTWVPTLYAGGLTTILALAAARWREPRQPWRGWLTALAVISLIAALGECGGPLFWARFHPGIAGWLGPHDSAQTLPIRLDDHLRDGDGSPYWLLATLLPGFRQFRFPSKMLTFTLLAICSLAGLGWDDLKGNDPRTRRRAVAWASCLLVATIGAALTAFFSRSAFEAWLPTAEKSSPFGPFDVVGAYWQMLGALGQGGAVLVATLGLVLMNRHRPQVAAAVALIVLTADLALANAPIVLTVPQSLFETPPEVLEAIQRSETADPSPGPFRVHRVPIWDPMGWVETASPNRVGDFVRWERDTLQPKYGINEGISYTLTFGVAELYDYEFFFGGFPRRANPEMQAALGVAPGSDVIYYPRRSFDLWTTRYFILPYVPRWDEEHRGVASFLDQTARIYPAADAFRGDRDRSREREWARTRDVQVLRNQAVYPRAWVVHDGKTLPPLDGAGRAERARPMEEIIFANDPVWRDSTRVVYDPRTLAWIEQADRPALAPFLPGTARTVEESVSVERYDSDRVELDANLRTQES
ncbi:MAG: hypothetical protein U0794_16450 [Isosphaeraceae bacterium]